MTPLASHETRYHSTESRILQCIQQQQLPFRITARQTPYEKGAYSLEMNGGGRWDYPAIIVPGHFRLAHSDTDMDVEVYASGSCLAEIFLPTELVEYGMEITLSVPPGISKDAALREPEKYLVNSREVLSGGVKRTPLVREEAAVASLAAKGYRGVASTIIPDQPAYGARGMRYVLHRQAHTLENVLADFSLKDVFQRG